MAMTDRPPAEGRTDLDLPGADAGAPSDRPDGPIGVEQQLRDLGDQPDSRDGDRRDELADPVGIGMPSPAGQTRSDVLPDVEVPDEQA
jgi:hypothetical protein